MPQQSLTNFWLAGWLRETESGKGGVGQHRNGKEREKTKERRETVQELPGTQPKTPNFIFQPIPFPRGLGDPLPADLQATQTMRERTVATGPFPQPDYMHWSQSTIFGTRAFSHGCEKKSWIPESRRGLESFRTQPALLNSSLLMVFEHTGAMRKYKIQPPLAAAASKPKKRRLNVPPSYYSNRLKGHKQGTH